MELKDIRLPGMWNQDQRFDKENVRVAASFPVGPCLTFSIVAYSPGFLKSSRVRVMARGRGRRQNAMIC